MSEDWKEHMERTINKHDLTLYGDGNGSPGLVRRVDPIERDLARIMKILMAVLTAVVIGLVLQLAKMAATAAPSQSVSQSVSTGTDAPRADDYTTADLAAKLGYSTREITDRAARGEIPGARKDGKAWRFSRAAVDAWAADAAGAAKTAGAADAAGKDEN